MVTPLEYKIIISEMRKSRKYNTLQRKLYGKETPKQRLDRVRDEFYYYLDSYKG
jgi:hypothetical protein